MDGKENQKESQKGSQKKQRKENDSTVVIGGRKVRFKTIGVTVVVVVALCLLVTVFQLWRYDRGVLEIYADQQDGYVELVMEQIALRDPEATDDEIIQEILGTLDASSGKYWTLSKDDYLVFVKDVLETNRYKGFTTSTYMVEQSADDFLNGLRRNWVTHGTVKIDGDTYIASGVEFVYNDAPYKICLLTNTNVILDNNAFLSAKITASIMLVLIFVIVLVIFLALAVDMDKLKQESEKLNTHIREQNIKIGELDQEMLQREQYSSRLNAYHISVLQTFLEKLRERQTYPLQLVKLSFDREQTREEFLEHAQMMLDKKVLRFTMTEGTKLLLIFLQYSESEARTSISRIKLYGEMNVTDLKTISGEEEMESIGQEFFE